MALLPVARENLDVKAAMGEAIDVPTYCFTEEELTAMRGGLTAEEYRLKLIGKWSKR